MILPSKATDKTTSSTQDVPRLLQKKGFLDTIWLKAKFWKKLCKIKQDSVQCKLPDGTAR